MNSVLTAIKGKGIGAFLRRGSRIVNRYGWTPSRMDRALARFADILAPFECGATFPITAVVHGRHPHVIAKYQARGIEFAVHGYRHIDHLGLAHKEQIAQFACAQQVLARTGIDSSGFRCPYLRGNADTWSALQQLGFAYDSSQGVAWDVTGGYETPAYRHVLAFYGAKSADEYPSLPCLQDRLVRIPYSLPDDEALVERLGLESAQSMVALWLAILDRTYESGELFTVGLHPERIAFCQEPLVAVLARARSLAPAVWIARLDEIASWWRARTDAMINVHETDSGALSLSVAGPPGTTLLARGVDVVGPTAPWANGYVQVQDISAVTIWCEKRPFIGVSPASPLHLVNFLRQQGYIVYTTTDRQQYEVYIDDDQFAAQDQRPLLSRIENGRFPFIRLGRWPYGAQSALSVTGDIDALTIWDYGLRSLGK